MNFNGKKLSSLLQVDKVFLYFVFSTVIFQGARFSSNIVAAKILSPQLFGVWNLLNMILIYGNLSNIGVLNGLGREFPFWEGKGDEEKKKRSEQVSFTLNVLGVSVFSVGAFLFFELASGWEKYREERNLLLFVLVFQQVNAYCLFRLRSGREFRLMGAMQMVMGVIHLLAAVFGAYFFGLKGFILGQIPAPLFVSLYLLFYRKYFKGFSLESETAKRLLRVGLPILAAGFVFSLLSTIDRWVILDALGETSLGYYSISIMAFSSLMLIPRIIADQIYPEMAYHFGKTNSRASLHQLFLRQTGLSVIALLPVIIPLYFFLPYLVNTFLPQYQQGISSAQYVLIGVLGIALAGGSGNFLNTVGLQNIYLLVQTIVVCVISVVAYILVRMLGIEGVGIAVGIGFILYGLILFLLVYRMTSHKDNLPDGVISEKQTFITL
ncbi:MAG: oligosaccharide flippase family protein [Ignavibacteriales bacterium]|nr:oligosaccharide flippase family protein [Ignavibacteriales bacterium]